MEAYVVIRNTLYEEYEVFFPAYRKIEDAQKKANQIVEELQEEVNGMRKFFEEEGLSNDDRYNNFRLVSENTWRGSNYDRTTVTIKQIQIV